MATPQEKLAESLAKLENLQTEGRRVFRSGELSRVHRERLVQQGFLSSVMRGWLISTNPGVGPGDTTPWYASYWEFCARYCSDRFGSDWHLSPEQSLLLQAENTVVPQQLVIYSPQGTNNTIELPFGTSLYDLKHPRRPESRDLVRWRGLPLYSPAAALIRVPEAFFRRHPLEASVILAGIGEPSDLIAQLLDGGHPVAAGRLAGALRRIGKGGFAEELIKAMTSAGYDVRKSDPFEPGVALDRSAVSANPLVNRLGAAWDSMRGAVLDIFPGPPADRVDTDHYLRRVDEVYQSDAYHSLSIEGYVVTPELVERVRSGEWDPEKSESDRENHNALAARGYWEAFQLVRGTVAGILAGDSAGNAVREAHRDWYRALFQPSVRAGLIPAAALAGYRNDAVFIRGSRHVPPRWEAVRDAMPALFDLLEEEPEPAVRAVLGHWLIGYIHPYSDGNGRMARFVMNAMLASGGYAWTVIRVEDRDEYLNTLEVASVDLNIAPFAAFVRERLE